MPCSTAPARSLPGLLQSLFGYNALAAGLVMSPAGFFAVLAMPVVSRLLGKQTDARWLIGAGLLVIAVSNYWMSQMNLDISPDQVIWPRAGLVVGLAIVFAPSECGRLSLHASVVTGGGSGPAESLTAQRRRQCWNIDGPDPPRTAGSIPYAAARQVPGPF